MKERILVILFLISGYSGIAKMKFGITSGAQLSSQMIVDNNTSTRLSFNAGGAAKTQIADGIDFNLQLLLSGKGYTYTDTYGYKNIFRPLYLELPVVVRFNFNSSNDTKIFLGAGGYYAYGIGGNRSFYTSGNRETQKINWGNDITDDLKESDFGLVFQLGGYFHENYEGHFFYDMGLAKIIPGTTSNSANRVFGFNLTWFL